MANEAYLIIQRKYFHEHMKVLHTQSLPVFRKPLVYHIYITLAFLSIAMTYFGVNYFLTGMHSYA